MPITRRRPKAVQKQKLSDKAKQGFNRLLKNTLPALVKNNPPTRCDQISTDMEFVNMGPTLPLLVLWDKEVPEQEKPLPQASINEFALDEFLNKHISPSDPAYGAVRDQVRYYLWIALLGDEDAAAHMRREIEGGLKIEPAVVEGVEA